MSFLNKPIITLIVSALFMALSIYSYERVNSDESLSAFVSARMSEYDNRTSAQKAIMDVWNISENDIAQPVNLWGQL